MMASPITLYLAAQLLVSDTPANVSDWRVHFEQVRRGYFAAVLATITFAGIRTIWVLGADYPFAFGLGVLGIGFVIGIFSSSRWVHAVLLILWLIFQTFAMSQRFTAV